MEVMAGSDMLTNRGRTGRVPMGCSVSVSYTHLDVYKRQDGTLAVDADYNNLEQEYSNLTLKIS